MYKEMINSWSETTIGKLEEIYKLFNLNNNKKKPNELDLETDIVKLLSDNKVNIKNLTPKQAENYIENTNFVYTTPQSAANVKNIYNFEGKEYECIYDLSKFTVLQWNNLQNVWRDSKDLKLIDLMSIIFVPKGKIYNDDYNKNDLEKILRNNITVMEGQGISNFFILAIRARKIYLEKCSEIMLKDGISTMTKEVNRLKKKKHLKKSTTKSGVGFQWFSK